MKIEIVEEGSETNLEEDWKDSIGLRKLDVAFKLLFGGTTWCIDLIKITKYRKFAFHGGGQLAKISQRYHFRNPKSHRNGTLFDTSLWR